MKIATVASLAAASIVFLTTSPTMSHAASSQAPVKVHFLELDASSNDALQKNPDLHRSLWELVNVHQPPRKEILEGSSEQQHQQQEEWSGITEGDLVVFPSLLTGAGEFEGMKFVGPKIISSDDDKSNTLPLLTAGIEHPEFPTLIVSMAKSRNQSLRQMYEEAFDIVLQNQPAKFTLRDLFSGDKEAVKEFWEDPPVARRRGPSFGSPWMISLGDCYWIRSVEVNFGGGEEPEL